MARLPKWNPEEWLPVGRFYRGAYATCRPALKAFVPIHARGIGNIPRTGPAVVVSNHYTWMDPVFLAAITPRPYRFLAKSGLFKYKWSDRFFRKNGAIPVYRNKAGGNEAAFQAGLEALQHGSLVALYPEGTRAPPGSMLPGKTGAVRLALATGAPIVPVGCASDTFWPIGKTFPRLGKGMWFDIGEPISLGHEPELADDKEYCRKATDDIMSRIAELLSGARVARDQKVKWEWAEK